MRISRKTPMILLAAAVFCTLFVANSPRTSRANHVPYSTGDVFAGIGSGLIKHFDGAGNLLETLDTGTNSGEDTGMAFDSAGNLYSTNFTDSSVSKFDNNGGLVSSRLLSGLNADGESIVFDAVGNFYVGHADGARDVLKFDAVGNLVATYDVATEDRGSDWIDLAADQCTMFYTSEGFLIKRFDVCNNTQLPDFANVGSAASYALRIRPNGEVIVASTSRVVRLNAGGNVIQTYSLPSNESSFFFALNLDPDGTSFWTAGYSSGNVYKYDIASGNILLQFNAGIQVTLAGLAIFEEQTVGVGDTDGDGLPDEWEVNGVDTTGDGQRDLFLDTLDEVGTDVPPNPNHKDIYVLVDWFVGQDGHSHKPDEAALQLVREAFANARASDVRNPDGQPGVNLHVVFGNAITETNDLMVLGNKLELGGLRVKYISDEFAQLKKASLQAGGARPGMASVFHYAVFAHYLPEITMDCPSRTGRPAGVAPAYTRFPFTNGGDFIIGHQSMKEQNRLGLLEQGAVFMHELGHALNLGHGGVGPDHTNQKPNHLSVMNYSFGKGLLFKQPGETTPTRSLLDYSRFGPEVIPNLNEDTGLNEQVGLNGGAAIENYGTIYYNGWQDTKGTVVTNVNAAIDWNFSGTIDSSPVNTNVNSDHRTSILPLCQDLRSDLSTSNEWKGLSYTQGTIGTVAALVEDYPSETIVEEPDLTEDIFGVVDPVLDLPPLADAGGPYAGIEGEVIAINAGGSTDPDAGDVLTYSFDCTNDGTFEAVDQPGSAFDCTYGDNGLYTARVRVKDAGGLTDEATAEVTVGNLAPAVTLGTTGSIVFAGGPAFLGRRGVAQPHSASATDPGSDDLRFEWSFAPITIGATGSIASTTYFNDGATPDPSPSPDGTFPFSATDTPSFTPALAGMHTVGVQVSDDDGGAASASRPKLVTDSQDCTRGQGFWRHQFSKRGDDDDDGGKPIDEATLLAYLGVVDFASAVYSEQVPAGTLAEAQAVFRAGGDDDDDDDGGDTAERRAKATRQALAAWLNFSQGAVGWDEIITVKAGEDSPPVTMTFQQLMGEVEATLLNPSASKKDLEKAKDLAEVVNQLDEDNPACGDVNDENDEDEEDGG